MYVLFALVLLLLNQGAFMFFKNDNIYQILGIHRGMPVGDIKHWAEKRRVEIYQIGSVPSTVPESSFLEMVGVVTHPARRLTYDSFGYSSV